MNTLYRASARFRPLAVAGVMLMLPTAHAQSLPVDPANPQSPAQRIEGYYDQRVTPVPQAPEPDPVQEAAAPDADAPPASDASVTFVLNDLRFGPTGLLPPDTLEGIAARHRGRTVSMADLQGIVDEVNAAYVEAGISTARALLSAQAIRDGVVQIDLIEGRLGELRIVGDDHTPERFVRRRVQQQPGDLVDAQALRDDLVRINRTTDLQARALLQPGETPGLTDIAIQIEAPSRRSWGVFVDNAGVESTGRERVGAQGQFWGLLGANDLLAGSLAWAEGGLEGRIGYSAIVNRRNGRLGATISRNQINIIDGAYADLDITGQSTSYGIDYRHPFVATQRWLLIGSGAIARVSSETEIEGELISDTASDMGTLALMVSYRAPGREISLSQAVSRVSIDEPLRSTDSFSIAPGQLTWMQRLGESGLLTRSTVGWQFAASDFVPSGNLFQLGGVGTVRGYERGVIGGPRGYYANIELHRPYRERHDVYLFADYGKVKADFPAQTTILGAGIGLSGQWGRRLSYSLDLGHAFDRVTGDQDSVRADFRIASTWQ